MSACGCGAAHHSLRVVLTGGPGAGKTAVLETARRVFCEHVAFVPEAASLLFRGGFPRFPTDEGRRSAQRAIYHVQVELETVMTDQADLALALCDRGTLDGIAYWPGTPDEYVRACETTIADELERYDAVIHLRTPPPSEYETHSNPLRVESAIEAAAIDDRILTAWAHHPRRIIVESTGDFLHKVTHTLRILRELVPRCCREKVDGYIAANSG